MKTSIFHSPDVRGYGAVPGGGLGADVEVRVASVEEGLPPLRQVAQIQARSADGVR